MEEETRVLIEVRLERGREDIETAKELLNLGRYRAAVNRSYYAILGVTTALLFTEKIERSKHAGIEAAFINISSKRGYLRKNMEGFLTIFGKRERSQITVSKQHLIRRLQKGLSVMLGNFLPV